MISQEYSEAIAETLDILEHTNIDDVNKIPKKFMNFLRENASKTYKCNLDYTKRIKDMNLKEKTIGILSVINKKYWCSEEERKVFDEKLKQNEIEYQKELKEKYNPDSIFTNNVANTKESNIVSNDNVQLVEYKEKNWFQKVFAKIWNIFNK